jgi:hypothetical protein
MDILPWLVDMADKHSEQGDMKEAGNQLQMLADSRLRWKEDILRHLSELDKLEAEKDTQIQVRFVADDLGTNNCLQLEDRRDSQRRQLVEEDGQEQPEIAQRQADQNRSTLR